MDKKYFFEEKNKIFGIEHKEALSDWCKEQWKEETAHVLRCAEDACENRFLFDFPWDMERTWEAYEFGEHIDWNLIPYGDREFLWQLNRHRFLLCLGQSYLLTGEERFAEHFARLTRDFTERAQTGENIDLGPWRTLETGIRAENWIRSLFFLEDSPVVDEAFLEFFLEQMRKHGIRLKENFSDHKYQSNWGAIESTGLLLIALALPGSGQQEQFLETALERLKMTAKLQVMEDGVNWEQSPMYHNEVYRSFLLAVYYGEKAGIVLPCEIKEAVRSMAFADLAWKKPDHTQFVQGDSDATDLRDQISAGAWLLQEPVLKAGGYEKLDFEHAWLFGWEACQAYGKMPVQQPDFTSVALTDSGNYYFRSSWEPVANLLHFRCGDMGAAHGHGDKLHVDLVLNGEDVLVDSGRYTYVEGQSRYDLKGVRGHNTTLVDHMEFTGLADSWSCSRLSMAVKQQYKEMEKSAFVSGGHLGYLDKGIFVNRKVIWIKPDIYLIVDEFYAQGEHEYEALFHFSAQGRVEEKESCFCFTGQGNEAFLQFPDHSIQWEIKESRQSLFYNRIMENQVLRAVKRKQGFYSMITVINGGEKGKTRPVTVERKSPRSVTHDREFKPWEAESLFIRKKEETGIKEYMVFIAHQEIFSPADTALTENCMGYGNVIVFDCLGKKDAFITGEVLSW